jgi:hypothetical protein
LFEASKTVTTYIGLQLPRRTVDALALQQQLLAQHEDLQARLQNLTQAAADDVDPNLWSLIFTIYFVVVHSLMFFNAPGTLKL